MENGGAVRLPLGKFEKFNAPVFIPRRWDWVDPLKDIKAHREALDARIAAPQEVIEAAGRDPEEVLEMIGEWQEKMKTYGVAPMPLVDKHGNIQTEDNENEDDDEKE